MSSSVALVQNAGSQPENTIQRGARDEHLAAQLQPFEKRLIQGVHPVASRAMRADERGSRRFRDSAVRTLRRPARRAACRPGGSRDQGAIDRLAIPVDAVMEQRHPDLQGAESAGLLKAVFGEPRRTSDAGRAAVDAQVRRHEAESRPLRLPCRTRMRPASTRTQSHLWGSRAMLSASLIAEKQRRISRSESRVRRRRHRRASRHRASARSPRSPPADRSLGIDRAGAGDDRHRCMTFLTVTRDGRLERRGRIRYPRRVESFRYGWIGRRAVRWPSGGTRVFPPSGRKRVGDGLCRRPDVRTSNPHFTAARDGQRGQCRHGSAADQQAEGFGRVAEQFFNHCTTCRST